MRGGGGGGSFACFDPYECLYSVATPQSVMVGIPIVWAWVKRNDKTYFRPRVSTQASSIHSAEIAFHSDSRGRPLVRFGFVRWKAPPFLHQLCKVPPPYHQELPDARGATEFIAVFYRQSARRGAMHHHLSAL